MSICKNLSSYTQALNHLSACSSAKAPNLVEQIVVSGLNIANEYKEQQQVLLHELFLRRVFYDLLNKICDPLINHITRRICLDQMYKPLFALKRFYTDQQHNLPKYHALEKELRVLSFEFLEYRK